MWSHWSQQWGRWIWGCITFLDIWLEQERNHSETKWANFVVFIKNSVWYLCHLMQWNMLLRQTLPFVRQLIAKESTLWCIASQAVKRKTCYCVGRTRTVTSPHVWPSTPHWGVERGIVKAKRPRPTCHYLLYMSRQRGRTKDNSCVSCQSFNERKKLGAHACED